MKITTFLIAFGPALAAVAIKFAIEPIWLKEVSFLACVGMGVVTGLIGAIAVDIVEPAD